DIDIYLDTLSRTFHISPWLMVVPLITGFMISRRLPAIITLFTATLCAAVAMWWTQSDIMAQIAEVAPAQLDATAKFTAIIKCCYGATAIETQYSDVTDLISTRGMEGMLNTIWLIICAMCFGGVLNGSGMLKRVTSSLLRMGKRTTTTVGSTVIGGVCFNLCTADQYISIILTGKLFKELYSKNGFEARLLSRSVEDSASVTSVLVPWNSCGMTQATVLGVATWVYLPYCIFNLVSPISSFIVAAIGYKIYRKTSNLKDATDGTDSDI
ncbi:MAG: Na+/H+ antiporter NhaC family protein, partial [Rikenellaceae bacterium]